MRPPIVKRKKVSFMNLVKELERVKPRFGKDVTLFVEVRYSNYSHKGDVVISYLCTYLLGHNVVVQRTSESPIDLIYQVEEYLKQSEPIIVNDVII